MSDEERAPTSDVEFELETDTTGKFVLKGKLPASLPAGMGNRLAKFIEAGFAGITPNLYRRATEGTLRTRIQKTVTDQICSNISDPQNRDLISSLFQSDLTGTAKKIERRAEIVERAVPMITRAVTEDETSRPYKTIDDQFLFHFWETADKVTQAELREIFSQILANEIASPGRTSAATLNMLLTLPPALASKFEVLCTMTFQYQELAFVITHMPHGEAPSTKRNTVSSSSKIGE